MGNNKKASASEKPQMLVNVVLDRSGSMGSTRKETVEGYNEYLSGLRKDKNTSYFLSLIQFDAHGGSIAPDLTVSYVDKPLESVQPLTLEDYEPRGMTPLYDAIGECVRRVDEKGRPVTTVIITDGAENASKEFSLAAIKSLIATKESKGWKFAFIGADIDSFAAGGKLGISAGATSNYAKGRERQTYAAMAGATVLRSANVAMHGLEEAGKMALFSAADRAAMTGGNPSNLLTPEEVADKLRVSRRTVYNQVRSGEIPARKVGRQWRINGKDI